MPISYVPFKLTLTSETTIYQNEVKCRVLENDFNFTQNPTALTGSVFSTNIDPFLVAENDDFIITENNNFIVADEFTYSVYKSDGTLANNVTGSAFNPYATTIGLYNDVNELLVVGKLATPYPIPENTDITFIVKWDS